MSEKTTKSKTAASKADELKAMQAELDKLKAEKAEAEKAAQKAETDKAEAEAAKEKAEIEAQKAKLAAEEAQRLKGEAEAELATRQEAASKQEQPAPIKDSPVKVKVYCKLPAGMRFPLPDGKELCLNGSHSSNSVLGFGVTSGVAYTIWEYVQKTYGALPAFKEGIIFARNDAAEDMSEINEKQGIKSGFEGVDPNKPGPGIKPAPQR